MMVMVRMIDDVGDDNNRGSGDEEYDDDDEEPSMIWPAGLSYKSLNHCVW